ncbi:MAG: phage portal protein [Planctomycetota bacterium]
MLLTPTDERAASQNGHATTELASVDLHAAAEPIDDALVEAAIDAHLTDTVPTLERLWSYYRNELGSGSGRAHASGPHAATLPQAAGLPARLRGEHTVAFDDRWTGRREVVIENDIAWRVHTMIDFVFGKPVRIRSIARDDEARERIEAVIDAVWEASGGVSLLQDAALLAHVFGSVEFVVRPDPLALAALAAEIDAGVSPGDIAQAIGEAIRIEVVDPRTGVPIIDAAGRMAGFAIHTEHVSSAGERSSTTEVLCPGLRRVLRDGEVVIEAEDAVFGSTLPVVHVQNLSQPMRYAGLSEVEPLVPLQDELNARLSDRARRVTMQSFRMWLAKGIENFEASQVGPGVVWSTDNPDASIDSFGGDAASPSEAAHIAEVREAMDKASTVPPLATGVVQGRIGNLSSAQALRVTLVGLLAKTARKRVTYGRGIAEVSRLVLQALSVTGVMPTPMRDRMVRLDWPDPLPEDLLDQTLAAQRLVSLGVSPEQMRDELGYEPTDAGVQ